MTADTFEFRKNGADAALVFLHGFTGDLRKTWGDFPMMLMGIGDLNGWDIFSVGYTSTLFIPDQKGLWKAAPDIQKLADTLVTRMEFGFDQYRKIAFAAHSMGGLIVQRALLDSDEIREKISHVFLFGTPSNGLLKAVIAAKLVGKKQVRDMKEGCPFIVRLRRDWEKAFGYDNFPFHFQSVSGDQDEFVPDTSAHGNFPRAHCQSIPGGHLEIVKPASPDHLAVRIVAKGLRERRSKPQDRPVTADEIDPHRQLSHEHQKWALRFLWKNPPDSEWVESAYRKAVSPQDREEWELPEPGSVGWIVIARELLERPLSPTKIHPLVPFLRNLGKRLDQKSPETAAYFQSVDAIAKHLGHQDFPLRNDLQVTCSLLIDLEEKSPSTAPPFTAKIHKWRAGDTPDDNPPEPFSGKELEIAQQVSKLLDGYADDDLPQRVEVFVSPDLLASVRPHEWLLVDDPGFEETFGKSYPTVIRLNRRHYGVRPEWINRWKRRWERLKFSDPCGMEELEESEIRNKKTLWQRLRRTDARPLLVAPFSISKETTDFGQVLWRAGIPVALWGENNGMDALLNEYSTLPDRLYAHRRDDPDSHFSLMWDNPERLPPWMSYQSSGKLLEGPTEKTT